MIFQDQNAKSDSGDFPFPFSCYEKLQSINPKVSLYMQAEKGPLGHRHPRMNTYVCLP